MKNIILCFLIAFISIKAQGKSIIKVAPIGASPKGQYVAFEEFGFTDDKKAFSKIRLFNTWKGKYISKEIVIGAKDKSVSLESIRLRAKEIANKRFAKFDLST